MSLDSSESVVKFSFLKSRSLVIATWLISVNCLGHFIWKNNSESNLLKISCRLKTLMPCFLLEGIFIVKL